MIYNIYFRVYTCRFVGNLGTVVTMFPKFQTNFNQVNNVNYCNDKWRNTLTGFLMLWVPEHLSSLQWPDQNA